jgi:5-deoxy-glucuronate isomerase
MQGRVHVAVAGIERTFARSSLFDESASCCTQGRAARCRLRRSTHTELTVYDCPNTQPFAARAFGPGDVPNEHRGRGQVRNRSLRFVRTIFDARNSPPQAELVLGEVVTLPGGWSSYPPHHHAQPEIYHYRFTAPQGYGHAEARRCRLQGAPVRHDPHSAGS